MYLSLEKAVFKFSFFTRRKHCLVVGSVAGSIHLQPRRKAIVSFRQLMLTLGSFKFIVDVLLLKDKLASQLYMELEVWLFTIACCNRPGSPRQG